MGCPKATPGQTLAWRWGPMKKQMSRKSFVGPSGSYNVRASELARDRLLKSIQCTVIFLDDTQKVFEIEKKSKGQVLLDKVFDYLELVEKDYFGLTFSDNGGLAPECMRWLDPLKSIRKQVGGMEPCTFYLQVKFYASDPSQLQEEYTRYLVSLQLRKNILDGRLHVPPCLGALLASYIVQAELGDHSLEEHGDGSGYLHHLRLLPDQSEDLEAKISELHRLHKGLTPADAEYRFLENVKRLELYGVDLRPARDANNLEIFLGVTSTGLVVFQNSTRINMFSWAKIIKLSFKRKYFLMTLRRELAEDFDSILVFNLLTYRSCKSLWKSCVEHHGFFRLQALPQGGVRKRFPFLLGSKFRYSGRTEHQAVEEGKRRARLNRSFVRASSRTFVRQTTVSNGSVNAVSSGTNGNSSGSASYSLVKKVQSVGGQEPKRAWESSGSPSSPPPPSVPPVPEE
ncbi:unnamed protein product [Darwinula stevensoni]|uniref:Moesin/ezrin/radixin homolog 1 n=1 Tax=Darwinula stevensoni TaxID=69355 RepID=A0A7R9AA36_9CRUS|nr:unnamed protein product [Darwinula stevensoni]CAG0898038.1 unnamed protein product [Darwinula stevensoni]